MPNIVLRYVGLYSPNFKSPKVISPNVNSQIYIFWPTFGEFAFSKLTLGEFTVREFTFGEVTFGKFAFGEMTFG